MTPEQQRIAIAQACGWTRKNVDLEYPLTRPEGRWEKDDKVVYHPGQLPNYLTDLNAMHEAEKVKIIGTEYESDYCMYLYENAHQCFATAPQRAEAFLRTLNLYIP